MKTAIIIPRTHTLNSSNGTFRRLLAVTLMCICAISTPARVYYSQTTGNWNSAASWSTVACGDAVNTGTYPQAGDTVFICSGHTITLSANAACERLTIDGTLQTANRDLTVTGNTLVNGTITDNNATGNVTFNNLVISSGGVFNNSMNAAVRINGDLHNDGTLISGSGIFTLTGSAKTLSGYITISRITLNGTYTNDGIMTVNAALSGTGGLTMAPGSMLYLGGSCGLSALDATASPNTITYTGVAGPQNIFVTTYHDLVIDNDGQIATLSGNITVNNDMSISAGTFQIGNGSHYSLMISGNLSLSAGTLFQYTSNSNRQHTLYITGDLTNEGTVNIMKDKDDFVALVFRGAGNSLISGNGLWSSLACLNMNKSSKTDTVHIISSGFGTALTTGAAILTKPYAAGKNPPVIFTSGTFRYDIPDALGNLINPDAAGNPSLTINPQVSVIVEQGSVDMAYYPGVGTKADLILQGDLILNGGSLTISKNSDYSDKNGLYFDGNPPYVPTFAMNGGDMLCYGAFTSLDGGADDMNFIMSGGTITTNLGPKATKEEPFGITDRSASSVNFTGGTIVIAQKSSYSGSWNDTDFDIGGTNTGSFHVSGTATVQFGSALTPGSCSMRFKAHPNVDYPHVIIANHGGGKTITLQPYNDAHWRFLSLTIETNQEFEVADVQTGNEFHTMTLTSDNGSCSFCNNGNFIRGRSTVKFAGTGTQTLCGSTVTMFRSLSLQSNCKFNVDANIFDTLSLNGVVDMNGYNLTLGTSVGNNGTMMRTGGYFYGGNFTRWFANAAVPDGNEARGLFPMGNELGQYRPLLVSYPTALSSGGSISVRYTNIESVTPVLIPDGPVVIVRRQNSRWEVSTTQFTGVAYSPFNLRGGGTGFYATDIQDLRLCRTSDVVGTAGVNTGTPDDVIAVRNGISVIGLNGNFHIGSINPYSAPLPVSLLSFTASTDNIVVDLDWQTASEVNNETFIVERSADAIDFEEMCRIPGAGNSNHLTEYHAVDSNPISGISYYRLKQLDFDGRPTYSSIIDVFVKKELSFSIYPNPVNGNIINVIFSEDISTDEMKLSMYNIQNQCVWSSNDFGGMLPAGQAVTLNIDRELKHGVYILEIRIGKTTYKKQLMVR